MDNYQAEQKGDNADQQADQQQEEVLRHEAQQEDCERRSYYITM